MSFPRRGEKIPNLRATIWELPIHLSSGARYVRLEHTRKNERDRRY